MEEINQNYESIVLNLSRSFSDGTSVHTINKRFEDLVRHPLLNDATVGTLFGFMLFWWTEAYKNPGDQKSMEILKQSILTIQEHRFVIYPQIWNHLQTTHNGLVEELFPERF
jgi:hypothetical protein